MAATAGEWELLAALDEGERRTHPERALILAGIQEPGWEAATTSVGGRDALVLGLRSRVLGHVLEAVDTCPDCGETASIEVDLRRLLDATPPDGSTTVRVGDYEIRCRPPSALDLAAAADSRDDASARRSLIGAAVVEARLHGRVVGATSLPGEVVAAVGEALSEADPLAEITLAVTCDACGGAWHTRLDPVGFVWEELRAWGRRLLAEIHVLASAYGWTEAEILALPHARRRAYRELVQHG